MWIILLRIKRIISELYKQKNINSLNVTWIHTLKIKDIWELFKPWVWFQPPEEGRWVLKRAELAFK